MATLDGLAELKIDRTRKRRRVPVWLLVTAGLFVAVVVVLPPAYEYWQGPEVSTAVVQKVSSLDEVSSAAGPESMELSAAGYVVAGRQSVLAAKVTGRLGAMNVSEAQTISQGFVVAEVDHAELDAQIQVLKTEIAEASAAVAHQRALVKHMVAQIAATRAPLETIDAEIREIEVQLSDAQRRFNRDKELAAKDAMPFSSADDRLTEINSAKARIATAKVRQRETEVRALASEAQAAAAGSAVEVSQAHVRALEARLKVMDTQRLDYFVIAPFDGIITEKVAEVGEIVAPISIGGNMARGSVATLADWGSLQAEVDVAEAYISRVKEQGRAAITVDAFAGETFPGRVLRILPRANRSKATVQVRVEFLKRPAKLLPDMGIRVKFLPENAPAGADSGQAPVKLIVPAAAIQAGSTPAVWVLKEGRASRRSVEAGEEKHGMVEVKKGLIQGEQVIVKGAEKLTSDERRVRLLPSDAPKK